jgi:antitoxin (DNA-binding transcriptional repressor) of toxin-antitoxin stability system
MCDVRVRISVHWRSALALTLAPRQLLNIPHNSPQGLHIRLDLSTGERSAKLLDPVDPGESVALVDVNATAADLAAIPTDVVLQRAGQRTAFDEHESRNAMERVRGVWT